MELEFHLKSSTIKSYSNIKNTGAMDVGECITVGYMCNNGTDWQQIC